jgi:hypothetical protein
MRRVLLVLVCACSCLLSSSQSHTNTLSSFASQWWRDFQQLRPSHRGKKPSRQNLAHINVVFSHYTLTLFSLQTALTAKSGGATFSSCGLLTAAVSSKCSRLAPTGNDALSRHWFVELSQLRVAFLLFFVMLFVLSSRDAAYRCFVRLHLVPINYIFVSNQQQQLSPLRGGRALQSPLHAARLVQLIPYAKDFVSDAITSSSALLFKASALVRVGSAMYCESASPL